MKTCRFCGAVNYDDMDITFVKYGLRHYAHHACFLKAKGEAGLRALPAWQVRQFPYLLLKQHGLLAVAEQMCCDSSRRAE